MTRVQKSYPLASFKALPAEGEGTFEAVVSVFGNVDLQGDRVMPGAFEKSIAKWQKRGDPVPVLWSHDWADPYAHIGYVDPQDMKEVPANQKAGFGGGLYVKGHLDVHKPFAKQVYDLLAERRVTEHSFSYDIPPGGEMRGKDGANELHTVDLIELGPTLKGANPATMTLGTKSDDPVDEEAERRIKLRLDRAHDDELRLQLEKVSWNGDAAMKACHSAADYRKISFERANDSDPDTAAHWALPHHSSPGADANPAGVSAALGALNGARGGAPDLKDKGAATSHLEAHQSAEKAFDPSQPRDAVGQWDAGSGPAHNGTSPGGADRKHTSENDAQHPLGEGTLSELKTALVHAGMSKEDAVKLSQAMREHFHQTGKIDIPKEADKFLPEKQRQQLGQAIRGEAEKRGWDPSTGEWNPKKSVGKVYVDVVPRIVDPDGVLEKSGRVVGAKAMAALKDALTSAVDSWASDMNGSGDGGGDMMKSAPPAPAPQPEVEAAPEPAEPGDKKDFAKGYADGTTGREKSETPTEEYLRGYEDGQTERAAVENQEIAQFNEIISGLKTT